MKRAGEYSANGNPMGQVGAALGLKLRDDEDVADGSGRLRGPRELNVVLVCAADSDGEIALRIGLRDRAN